MKTILTEDKKNGFTLAELLVVVAIIAILIALSIVIFTGKQKEAKATVCEANRTSLKHHLVADYLSGDLEQMSETVLADYIWTDEAVCPSGGRYSYTGTLDSGFRIICSYHNGDGSEGEKEPKSIVDNLIDAVGELMGITGDTRNDDIIRSFFGSAGKAYQKFVKDMKMSDLLKGVNLDALAEQIKEMNQDKGGDAASLKKALEQYASKTLKVVPYYSEGGKTVVPYYVSQEDYESLKSGKATHKASSVCYVNGSWYFNKETNYNATALSKKSMVSVDLALKEAKSGQISTEEAMKKQGWIKIK